ncbi:MAG: GNAT family N-acetyltransferase [Kangiellaceae bacterium]|nr:GNAT family N-acetyltransferase [Kangiellaceae bacterium]
MNLEIKQINWREALPIRHEVLWPEEEIAFCKVDGDDDAFHFGGFVENNLACVASIYLQDRKARLRKFATLQKHQGQGIGSKLLAHIILELKQRDITYLWCDARKTASKFYQRFGMQPVGNEFTKSGLPYFKMGVNLSVEN